MNTHPYYPDRCVNNPPFYEHPCLEKNTSTWADFQDVNQEELSQRYIWNFDSDTPKLITLKDAKIEFEDGKPVTPIKTGIKGRGLLGRFGPNHAADPIVTKTIDNKLYVIAVLRNDTGEWAIPGGMVDPGEHGIQALRREFKEETCQECDDSVLDMVFAKNNGKIIYAGPTYGDPRTTDSAWIETIVAHYHISDELASKITLMPEKKEVRDVKWISCDEKFYGGHNDFIEIVKHSFTKDQQEKTSNNLKCIYQNKCSGCIMS